MQKLTVHPMAEKFPNIPPKKFQELKNSIKTDGQLSPIVINEAGQILEGRHRYRACQELEIEPSTVQLRDVLGERFGHVSEAKFIFDCNYHRRHLTDDQRVALCAAFLPELRAKSKRGRPPKIKEGQTTNIKNGGDSGGNVRDQLADIAKVGETKVKKAIDLADADPELLDQVSRGEKKLAEAHHEMESKQANSEQISKEVRQKKLRTAGKYDYQKVDRLWLKHWAKFLGQYEESSWPQIRIFVIDSLKAEQDAERSEAEGENLS